MTKVKLNKHGYQIVVNADRSDWGKRWGLAKKNDPRCWCYDCSMERLDKKLKEEKP